MKSHAKIVIKNDIAVHSWTTEPTRNRPDWEAAKTIEVEEETSTRSPAHPPGSLVRHQGFELLGQE